MKLFAIGDIHGCFDALEAVLRSADPRSEDTVVFLGDYVDRGPDSRRLLDWLCRDQFPFNTVFLRGNHEIMMMESRQNPFLFQDWLLCGGQATLESYGWNGQLKWTGLVPDAHWAFLESTHSWMETEDFILVHANVVPTLDLDQHDDFQLYWEKCHHLAEHKSGKRVVVGHTRQTNGVPRQWEGGVCIDTAAVSGQWLTCLELASGEYHQANQSRKTRKGSLGVW